MKRKIVFVLLAVVTLLLADAGALSTTQARFVAEQFVQSRTLKRAPGSQSHVELSLAYEALSSGGCADYFVFNCNSDEGFIVVSGDDAALPVLGYSDSGTFSYDSLPDNARWWLGEYQRELQYARSSSCAPRRMTMLNSRVLPLVKTVWDQGSPYNDMCPTFNGGRSRAVSGCVATAVAQIMKVHNWPSVGEGSVTYDCNVNGEPATTLSADFSQIHFQWNLMRDNYNFGRSSEAQCHAVAELMSAVGIATEMMYGASSGTHSIKAFDALRDHFRYDKGMSFRLRDFMPLDEWEQLLRDELDAGRPVYYAGQSGMSGGHAFVFDGYNVDGYFHVNWGWGGRDDGYFACSALNPQSYPEGFNSGQEAIIGIQPDRGGTTAVQPLQGYMSEFGTKVPSAPMGGEVPLSMINFTFLGEGEMNLVDFVVGVYDATGTESIALLPVTTEETWKGYTYYFSDDEPISMTLPSDMAAGDYRLRVMYSLDSMVTVHPFVRKADSAGYVKMTVSDGIATFDNQVIPVGVPEVVTPLSPKAATMPADDVQGEVLLKSAGGLYEGELTMRALRKSAGGDFETIAQATAAVAFDHNGEQKLISFNTVVNASEGDTCYLALMDPSSPDVFQSEPVPFVIGEWPLPEPAVVTPEADALVDFGYIFTNETYVEIINLQAENLGSSLSLSIGGADANLFSVNPSTISQTSAMRGTKVNVKYRALALGNHKAELVISGGGMQEPVIIPLRGSAFFRGDINGDDVVDVADANLLINIIVGKATNEHPRLSDLNGDKVVDVEDVSRLINIMLGKD